MKLPDRLQFSQAVLAVVMTIVAALVTFGAFLWQNFGSTSRIITPTSFAECRESEGSHIQESYPEVCVTAGGERFVNPDQSADAS